MKWMCFKGLRLHQEDRRWFTPTRVGTEPTMALVQSHPYSMPRAKPGCDPRPGLSGPGSQTKPGRPGRVFC